MTLRSLILASLVATSVIIARAADYYLLADQPADGSNWNSLDEWFESPTGGANPTGLAEHRFLTNSKVVRASEGTFGGAMLILNGGAIALKTQSSSQTASVATLVSTGGMIIQRNTFTQNTLAVKQFINLGSTTLAAASGRGFTIAATTLTGDGNLVVSDAGTLRVEITDASTYRGTINVGTAASTLEFGTGFVSSGESGPRGPEIRRGRRGLAFACKLLKRVDYKLPFETVTNGHNHPPRRCVVCKSGT